jgi:hypothetical protein
MKQWYDNFITMHQVCRYTAWDESQTNELGTFDTYEEAKQCLIEYAKSLNPVLTRTPPTNPNERTV